jgi:hypothetical protein
MPAPPAGPPPTGSTPEAAPSGSTTAQSCQTVTVEGHYETRVLANGQRVTAWVPAYARELCP